MSKYSKKKRNFTKPQTALFIQKLWPGSEPFNEFSIICTNWHGSHIFTPLKTKFQIRIQLIDIYKRSNKNIDLRARQHELPRVQQTYV